MLSPGARCHGCRYTRRYHTCREHIESLDVVKAGRQGRTLLHCSAQPETFPVTDALTPPRVSHERCVTLSREAEECCDHGGRHVRFCQRCSSFHAVDAFEGALSPGPQHSSTFRLAVSTFCGMRWAVVK